MRWGQFEVVAYKHKGLNESVQAGLGIKVQIQSRFRQWRELKIEVKDSVLSAYTMLSKFFIAFRTKTSKYRENKKSLVFQIVLYAHL